MVNENQLKKLTKGVFMNASDENTERGIINNNLSYDELMERYVSLMEKMQEMTESVEILLENNNVLPKNTQKVMIQIKGRVFAGEMEIIK